MVVVSICCLANDQLSVEISLGGVVCLALTMRDTICRRVTKRLTVLPTCLIAELSFI